MKYLRKMAHNHSVIGLKIPDNSYEFCEDCVHGKMHKLPVLQHCEKKSTKPLELVHIDMKTLETPSKQGCRYFMILVDDFTRKKFGYPLKHRDEQMECFRKFKTEAERKFPKCKVKILQSIKTDGAGEFISEKFKNYLQQCGITHEQRAADSENRLGIAERAIRTIFEMVNTMLQQARFGPEYWLEAANTALYTLERCGTSGIPPGKTPYEMWWGRKPKVAHFRCFARKADNKRKAIGSKAIPCILLGYQGGGYRLLNQETGKVINRRHVIFDERSMMGNKTPIPQKQPRITNNFDMTPPISEGQEETKTNTEATVDQSPVRIAEAEQARIAEPEPRRSARTNLGVPPDRLTYSNLLEYTETPAQE